MIIAPCLDHLLAKTLLQLIPFKRWRSSTQHEYRHTCGRVCHSGRNQDMQKTSKNLTALGDLTSLENPRDTARLSSRTRGASRDELDEMAHASILNYHRETYAPGRKHCSTPGSFVTDQLISSLQREIAATHEQLIGSAGSRPARATTTGGTRGMPRTAGQARKGRVR